MQVSQKLHPYISQSQQGDWYQGLNGFVKGKPNEELKQVMQEVDEQLECLGPLHINQHANLMRIYLNRVKQTCRKKLYLN